MNDDIERQSIGQTSKGRPLPGLSSCFGCLSGCSGLSFAVFWPVVSSGKEKRKKPFTNRIREFERQKKRKENLCYAFYSVENLCKYVYVLDAATEVVDF